MDMIKTGGIFTVKAFQSRKRLRSGPQVDITHNRSRFEELFRSSPRAKVVLKSLEKSASLSSVSHSVLDGPDPEDSVINMTQFFKGGPISSCRPEELWNGQELEPAESSTLPSNVPPTSVPVDSGVHDVNSSSSGSTLTDTAPKERSNMTRPWRSQRKALEEVQEVNDLDFVPESPQDEENSTADSDDSVAGKSTKSTHEETDSPKEKRARGSSSQPSTKPNKSHTFKDWEVKVIKNQQGIIVEGQREQDPAGERWHSTAIIKRIHSRCVQTKSESQYNLEGPMNKQMVLDQGFSKDFVKAFKNGFPANWMELVAKHFDYQVRSEGRVDENTTIYPRTEAASRTLRSSKRTNEPKESASNRKGKTRVSTPKDRLRKPVEVELKRTSSGRIVKPPLAWWRGQRVLTDGKHNLIGIEAGSEELTPVSSSMMNRSLRLPPRSEGSDSSESAQNVRSRKGSRTKVTDSSESAQNVRSRKGSRNKVTDSSESAQDVSSDQGSRNKVTDSSESAQDVRSRRGSRNKVIESDSDEEAIKKPGKRVPHREPLVTGKKDVVSSGSNEKQLDRSQKPVKQVISVVISSESDAPVRQARSPRHRKAAAQVVPDTFTASVASENDSSEEEAAAIRHNTTSRGTQVKVTSESELSEKLFRVSRSTRQKSRLKQATATRENESSDEQNDTDSQSSEDGSPSHAKNFTRRESRSKTGKRAGASTLYNEQSETDSQASDVLNAAVGRSKRPYTNITSWKEHVQSAMSKFTKDSRERTTDRHVRIRGKDTVPEGASKTASNVDKPRNTRAANGNEAPRKNGQMLVNPHTEKIKPTNHTQNDNDAPVKSGRKQLVNHARNDDKAPERGGKKPMLQTEDDIDDINWHNEEIMRLDKAMQSISPTTSMFWQKVARLVRTRTAEECQLQHQAQLKLCIKKKAHSKKNPNKAAEKVDKPKLQLKTVTGGVGTIKRKRELRQLLEQHDEGYEDDIFDGTPFKKTRQLKIPFDMKDSDSVEDGEAGDDAEEEEEEVEPGVVFRTPSSRTPNNRFRPLGPPPDSLTSSSDLISPSLLQQVNRKDIDRYIYKMQQGKRGAQQHKKQQKQTQSVRTSTPKKVAPKGQAFRVQSGMFDVRPVIPDEASDEEQDDYWSDEEL